MAATKKTLVIVLMVVLVSSVAASSYFVGTPSTKIDNQDINNQLNTIIDFCLKSLPKGTPECDNQLGDIVVSTCNANNNNLDACMNDKVNQYYSMRRIG